MPFNAQNHPATLNSPSTHPTILFLNSPPTQLIPSFPPINQTTLKHFLKSEQPSFGV